MIDSTTHQSLSGVDEDRAKYFRPEFIRELKEYLMLLGFSNNEAIVCAIFLYEMDPLLPITRLMTYVGSKKRTDDGISCLINKGILSHHIDKNSRGRIVKYYFLSKKPIEIHEYLNEKNSKILNGMIDDYNSVEPYLNSSFRPSIPDLLKIETYLIKLGLSSDIAKIIVYLDNHPYTSQKDMVSNLQLDDPRKLTGYLQELYRLGWIDTLKSRYQLSRAINDIALEYISIYADNIQNVLNKLLQFIKFKDKYDECNLPILNDHQSEYFTILSTCDKRFKKNRQIMKYSEIFYEAIKDQVVSHTSFEVTPLNLTLKPPYPEKTRIYLYKLSQNGACGFKSVLKVPEQAYGTRGHFNFDDTTFVIIGGYHPDKYLFVFWDAYLHDNFRYNKYIQVKQETVDKAEIMGIATQKRVLDSGDTEYIIVITRENILKGIELHYRNYINRMLGD